MFLINLLLSPIGELSEILDQTQTAISGWRKVLAVLDVPIDVAEPVDGVHLAHGALGDRGVAHRVRVPRRRARPARRECRHRGRNPRRDRRGDGFGQDRRSPSCCAGSRIRRGDRCASATAISATSIRSPAGARFAWCRRTASCSTRRSPTTCAWPNRTQPTTTSSTPSPVSGSTGGCCACPTASRRWWASGASRCRWASANSSRWRARSSAIPDCSCSTRPRARSMPRPNARWPTRWRACRAAARRSASPTVSRPPSTPTACSCSTRAASSRPAATTSSSPPAASTRELYRSWTANTRTA